MICPTCGHKVPKDQEPNLSSLTSRQREVYDYIRDFTAEMGYPPTIREIGEAFGIRSPNGVMCHLRALETKGVIDQGHGTSRSITIM